MTNQVRRTVPCARTVIVVSVIIIVDAAALLGFLAVAFDVGDGGAAFVSLFSVETCYLGTVPQLRHVIIQSGSGLLCAKRSIGRCGRNASYSRNCN